MLLKNNVSGIPNRINVTRRIHVDSREKGLNANEVKKIGNGRNKHGVDGRIKGENSHCKDICNGISSDDDLKRIQKSILEGKRIGGQSV